MGIFDEIRSTVADAKEQLDDEMAVSREPCPNCGNTEFVVSISGKPRCRRCDETYSRDTVGPAGTGPKAKERATELVKSAHGSLTVEDLTKSRGTYQGFDGGSILSMIGTDEQPHYVYEGSKVTVDAGDGPSSKSNLTSQVYTVLTDSRILVTVVGQHEKDTMTIPYDSITSVDIDSGMVHNYLVIDTSGRVYNIGTLEKNRPMLDSALDFIRERCEADAEGENLPDDSSTPDPLDQLERLKELADAGAIEDEEFQRKKAELLDRI